MRIAARLHPIPCSEGRGLLPHLSLDFLLQQGYYLPLSQSAAEDGNEGVGGLGCGHKVERELRRSTCWSTSIKYD